MHSCFEDEKETCEDDRTIDECWSEEHLEVVQQNVICLQKVGLVCETRFLFTNLECVPGERSYEKEHRI